LIYRAMRGFGKRPLTRVKIREFCVSRKRQRLC
jgi:hypothetical protein